MIGGRSAQPCGSEPAIFSDSLIPAHPRQVRSSDGGCHLGSPGGRAMTAAEEEERSDAPRQVGLLPSELLRHATLCWEAELENARRHANRMNLLLPVILGVLGLGAFNLG